MTILLAAVIVLSVLYIINYYRTVSNYPRGPFPLPLIGNLHQVNFHDIDSWINNLAKKYGPIFTIYIPRPNVIITKYEYIREALIANGDLYTGRNVFFPITLLRKAENGGVVFSDGENWRQQRKCTIRILRDFGMGKNLMEEQVMKSVQQFIQQLHKIDDKANVDFRWPLQLCVANVIYETLFGYHYKYDDCERLKTFVNYFEKDIAVLGSSSFVRLSHIFPFLLKISLFKKFGIEKGEKAAAKIWQFIEEEVELQKVKYDSNGPPQTFVQAYFKAMESGNSYLTYEQLTDVVSDLWVAGMETTTSTLRWAVLLLQRNRSVQDKMRREIYDVVGKNRYVKMSDKTELPYCTAAIMEIQRRANIIAFNLGRRTLADTVIGGLRIPKNTEVTPQIASVMSDPNFFTEPMELNPMRFLDDDGKSFKKDAVDRVIPFGMGKRQCVGESLARTELFLVITNLLQNFRLEISPNQLIADYSTYAGPFRQLKEFSVKIIPLQQNQTDM